MSVRLALATASPTLGTTSRVISGPNPKLAMLRALALRSAFLARQSWHGLRAAGRSIAKAPGWMGQVVLSVLSTPAGYTSAVTLTSTGVRVVLRGADVAIRAVGRLAAIATGTACAAVGSVIPAWRSALIVAHADAVDRINHVYEQATTTIARFADRVRSAAHTGLVQTVATRAAAVTSALLVLHVLTKGAIALHLVQLVPAAAAMVAWLTSPWLAVFGVLSVTAAVLAYALWATSRVDLADLDMAVEISADGSITVTGIPDQLSPGAQEQAVREASTTALSALNASVSRPARTRSRTRKPAARANSASISAPV
jgi:hypothetical protein